jgi:hypothetical protein
MKTCVIIGEMTSDRASENYPTVQVCDECIEYDKSLQEDHQIRAVQEYDPSYGDVCFFCKKTYDQKQQGK